MNRSISYSACIFFVLICASFPVAWSFAEGYFIDLKAFREQTGLRLAQQPSGVVTPLFPSEGDFATGGYGYADAMSDDPYQISRFAAQLEKQSPSSRMGIRLSRSRGFIDTRGLPAASSGDRMVSDILETMPDLWNKQSQAQSLDRLGRIVEPRVMFYFEF